MFCPGWGYLGGVRTLVCILALGLTAPLGGCYRYVTRVPGVLDMRSDASGADARKVARPSDPDLVRSGLEAEVLGPGLVVEANEVRVRERRVWVRGLIPLVDDSSGEEIGAALHGGALRDVVIGDEIDGVSVIVTVVVPSLLPITGLVLPPFTFVARGTPIAGRPAPFEAAPFDAAPAPSAPAPSAPALEPSTGAPLPLATPPLLDDAPLDPAEDPVTPPPPETPQAPATDPAEEAPL